MGGDNNEIDLSGYATKDDITNAINKIDYPVDTVNGKTGAVTLSATDVGATPASHSTDNNNPHGVTAAQIGAATQEYVISAINNFTFYVVSDTAPSNTSLLWLKPV